VVKGVICLVLQGQNWNLNNVFAKCLHQLQTNSKDWLDRSVSRAELAPRRPRHIKTGAGPTGPANGKGALDAFHFHLVYRCPKTSSTICHDEDDRGRFPVVLVHVPVSVQFIVASDAESRTSGGRGCGHPLRRRPDVVRHHVQGSCRCVPPRCRPAREIENGDGVSWIDLGAPTPP
jgi:hypothetical protein